MLTQALVHHAWAAAYAGEWMAASASAAEGAALARDTNQPQFGITGELIAALVAAMRGTNPDIDGILAGLERTALALKGGPLLAPAHLARGAAALGGGRHEDAFESLWPVFDEADESFHRFMRWPAVLDLVEAAVGSGQAHRIDGVMADLEAIAARTGPPILCAGLACARPLLAADHQVRPALRSGARPGPGRLSIPACADAFLIWAVVATPETKLGRPCAAAQKHRGLRRPRRDRLGNARP